MTKTNYPVVCLACMLNLCASGVVFGWGALITILQKQGVYSNHCIPQSNHTIAGGSDNGVCSEQQLRLNTVFLLGTFASMFMSFPSGYIMDKTSSKLAVLAGLTLHLVGSTLFSLSSNVLDMFPIGYFLMGAAAPFVLLGCVTIVASNVEEKRKGFFIAIVNGCYDASAIMWQVYVWLDASVTGGIAYSSWFLIFLCFSVVLFLLVLFCVPGNLMLCAAEDTTKDDLVEIELSETKNSEDVLNVSQHSTSGATEEREVLPKQSLSMQLRSTEFIVFAIFFCTGLLRFSYYIGSLDPHLTWLGQKDGEYSIIFGAILPFGILSTPVIGFLIDWKGLKYGFFAVYFFKFLHSLLVLIPSLEVQVASFVCFAVFRGCFFSVCSAYLIDTFGLKMGKVFGIAATFGALTSLTQSALLSLSLSLNNFVPSNIIVLVFTCAMFAIHCWFFNCR